MVSRVIGLDLAGVDTRSTGLVYMEAELADRLICVNLVARTVYSDDEIHETIGHFRPELIAIDAPLTYPRHRCCFRPECGCKSRNPSSAREIERELWRRGIRVFPCGFGGMRKLTERGVKLRTVLEQSGFRVIEVYPGATQDILGIPRKRKARRALYEGLAQYLGLDVAELADMNDHELDALTSAITGVMHLHNMTEVIGDAEEGLLVVPLSQVSRTVGGD